MSRVPTILIKLTSLFAVFTLGLTLTFGFSSPSRAYGLSDTQSKGDVCQGIAEVDSSNNCDSTGSGLTLGSLVSTIINILSYITGAIAVVMMIIGGFKFVTSGGDSAKVSSAKGTIVYALVGIAVAALAQVMIHFVLTNLAKAK